MCISPSPLLLTKADQQRLVATGLWEQKLGGIGLKQTVLTQRQTLLGKK